MQLRTIPGTGLQISRLALGGWLTLGDRLDDTQSLQLLRAAHANGVRLFDLADVYGQGGAERIVGRFLREVPRDQLVISSKVFWPTSDDPADRGLSRRHIFAAIERSLQRLGIEHLDLYFCHREDPTVPLAETVQAMGDLVRSGKVRAWGTSCWRPATLSAATELAQQLGVEPPRVEQPPYSLLERNIEAAVLPRCKELGMAVVVWSPLAGGALTGKYLNGLPTGSRGATTRWLERHLQPAAQRAVRRYLAVCAEHSLDPAAAALAWVLARPEIDAAILGCSSPEQLHNNLAAYDLRLAEDTLSAIQGCFPVADRQRWHRILSWLRRLFRKRPKHIS